MKKDRKIIVIGAGISGLIAAIELEKQGFAPTILEATDRVGGRVKTDYENGFQFDHGFQVLLTAYPEVSRYLDLKSLKLSNFKPGATIYDSGKSNRLVDPLRQPTELFTAAFSPVASLQDKLKMWRLTEHLKRTSVEDIFNATSITTLEYLEQQGFSQRIIRNFFRPFFSGIFLERELSTSSRLFQFIFKMFAEGYAAIPAKGMQAIPDQLLSRLNKTEVRYNTRVEQVKDGQVHTSSGDFPFDGLIITSAPGEILSDYKSPAIEFKSTVNLYFTTPKKQGDGYIGLIPSSSSLINNISVLSDVAAGYAPADSNLLSVSVIGTPEIDETELNETIRAELATILKLDLPHIQHLRNHKIKFALPIVDEPVMNLTREQSRYDKGIYLAGDYLLGGSLNGAMVSGRQSAAFLIEDLGN